MILAGDIGGTKTRLGFFKVSGGLPVCEIEEKYDSPNYKGLEEIAAAFLQDPRVKAKRLQAKRACFGIAGPIKDGRVKPPNLGWAVIDSAAVERRLGISQVKLINDLEANAYGIAALKPKDFAMVNRGARKAEGNGAVISVGTGLGEAGLYWDGHQHHPFACEGGHVDFAPRDELETDLLRYLRRDREHVGHVSYERVLSGPGQRLIYEFLRERARTPEPGWLTEAMQQSDPSAVITQAGLQGQCEVCVRALDLFVSFYGAEAGNLALKVMARGGVYIGGGIAPKILPKLQSPLFLSAFKAKGRMRDLMEAMPVRVILEPRTALFGAARCAALLA